MTTLLPNPKRFVFTELLRFSNNEWFFDGYTDTDVSDFISLLACVSSESEWLNKVFRIRIDPRYGYSEETAINCRLWIMEQVESEYADADFQIKPQEL